MKTKQEFINEILTKGIACQLDYDAHKTLNEDLGQVYNELVIHREYGEELKKQFDDLQEKLENEKSITDTLLNLLQRHTLYGESIEHFIEEAKLLLKPKGL